MDYQINIDAHCHIFDMDCLPSIFQDRYTKGFKPEFLKAFLTVFNDWFDNDDLMDRAKDLLRIASQSSINDVAKILYKQSRIRNHKVTIFVPLMMDMEFGINDDDVQAKKNFDKQLIEYTKVVKENPFHFLPFVAADPRRIKLMKDKNNSNDKYGINYIIDALENKGFWGVKIYPPLGYLPTDENLYPLYKYCEDNYIPITTHCCFAGTYSNVDLPDNLLDDNGKKMKKKKYYGMLAEPQNYIKVLQDFPKLKLNFGHAGGDLLGKDIEMWVNDKQQVAIEKDWRKQIEMLMQYNIVHPNLYCDISFHPHIFIEPKEYFDVLKNELRTKNMSNKIMFGTDWWMSRFILQEHEYISKFKEYAIMYGITKQELANIMYNNAVEFLGLDNPKNGPLKNRINFINNNITDKSKIKEIDRILNGFEKVFVTE